MNKDDIDSILLINWIFVKCEFENKNDEKVSFLKKYLYRTIRKIMYKKASTNEVKAFDEIDD